MTSPVVSVIDSISTSNMFDEYLPDISVEIAMNILKGEFPIYKFLEGKEYKESEHTMYDNFFGTVKDRLSNDLMSLGYEFNNLRLEDLLKSYFQARLAGNIKTTLYDYVVIYNSKYGYNLNAFCDFFEGIINTVQEQLEISKQSIEDFYKDLDEFSNIYENASESTTLTTTFLGLNQGLPNSEEDVINKILKIEASVRSREKYLGISRKTLEDPDLSTYIYSKLQDRNPFLSKDYIAASIDKALELDIVENFDFYKWLDNKNGYREATKNYYNVIKATWNIFDIIDKVPHYKSIIDLFKTAIYLKDNTIKKSYMINLIVKDLFPKNFSIDTLTYNKLIDYVDTLILLKWLDTRKFQIPVFNGQVIFKSNWGAFKYKGDPNFITLDTEEARGTFKKYIEEELIPNLKKGFYKDIEQVDDGNGGFKYVEVLKKIDKDNQFIKTLTYDIDRSTKQRYLKLDLDMQNISSSAYNEVQYQKCLNDFIKLKTEFIGNESITDILMLYNLLINKNKFGRDRLTTLFESFIGIIKDNSIIKEVMQYLGDFDFKEKDTPKTLKDLYEWGYHRDDALFAVAPIVSEAQESSTKAEIILQRNGEGRLVFKRRLDSGYPEWASEIISDDYNEIFGSEENRASRAERYLNYKNYGVLKIPMASLRNNNITKLESYDENTIYEALYNLTKSGIITINTDNC